MNFDQLYQRACDTLNPRSLSQRTKASFVAAALLSDSGNVYVRAASTAPARWIPAPNMPPLPPWSQREKTALSS